MGGKQKNKKREGKKDVVEHHRAAAAVKYLNLLCILSGLYMTAVGCMLVYDGLSSDVGLGFTDSDNIGMWITIIYSTILGLLVLATSLKVRLIMEQFSFVSHLLGRGVMYLFIGTYYLNVTTGGISLAWERITADEPDDGWPGGVSEFEYKRDFLATFLAGALVTVAGATYIILYIIPCFVGCCGDEEENHGHSVADISNTAVKDIPWLDKILRLLTVAVGCLLMMASHKLWSAHFDGCVPVKSSDFSNYECRHELNRWTAVYLFDALYAGLFGLTVIFAGLEWVVFIKHFGFLSRPTGKTLYFFFVSIYFMGSGSPFRWSRIEQMFDTPWDQQIPVLAGLLLFCVGSIYGSLSCCPCVGGCCEDSQGGAVAKQRHKKKHKKKSNTVHETQNPVRTYDVEDGTGRAVAGTEFET